MNILVISAMLVAAMVTVGASVVPLAKGVNKESYAHSVSKNRHEQHSGSGSKFDDTYGNHESQKDRHDSVQADIKASNDYYGYNRYQQPAFGGYGYYPAVHGFYPAGPGYGHVPSAAFVNRPYGYYG